MNIDTLEILQNNCDGTKEQIEEAYEEAKVFGIVTENDEYNNPQELIGFVNGFLVARLIGMY